METKYLRNVSKIKKSEKLSNSQHVSQMKKQKLLQGHGKKELSSLCFDAQRKVSYLLKKNNCDHILLFSTLHFNKEHCLIFLTNNRNKSKLYF